MGLDWGNVYRVDLRKVGYWCVTYGDLLIDEAKGVLFGVEQVQVGLLKGPWCLVKQLVVGRWVRELEGLLIVVIHLIIYKLR